MNNWINYSKEKPPKFVKKYTSLGEEIKKAVGNYIAGGARRTQFRAKLTTGEECRPALISPPPADLRRLRSLLVCAPGGI